MIPSICGCGCGAPINEKVIAVVRARQAGCSVREAAARAGVTYATAKMAGRQFSRFRPGHAVRSRGPWEERTCPHCKGTYRTPRGSARTRCRNCPALSAEDWIRANMAEYDAREAEKNRRLRENRFALFGGRKPRAMGTPRWLRAQRAQWEHLFFGEPKTLDRWALVNDEQRRLVAENGGLVAVGLRGYHPLPGMDADDLWQTGVLGLMKAAKGFDPERGVKFSTYAVRCISNEINTALYAASTVKRGGTGYSGGKSPRMGVAPTSIEALSEGGFDIATEAEDVSDSMYVADVLARAADLDHRLPEVLRRRMDGESVRDIARSLRVSSQRIYQLLMDARSLVEVA